MGLSFFEKIPGKKFGKQKTKQIPMPKRKRYARRRKGRSRRKGRRKRITRIPRVYRFKRSNIQRYNLFTLGGQSDFFAQHHTFRLNNLEQHDEFDALFTEYRIDKVVCRMLPQYTSAGAPGTGEATDPKVGNPSQIMMYRLYDKTGLYDTTTLDELMQCQRFKEMGVISAGSKSKTIMNFKPAISNAVEEQVSAGQYIAGIVKPSPWIPVEHDSIAHYGVSLFYQTVDGRNFASALGATQGAPTLLFHYTYYLSFRGVR